MAACVFWPTVEALATVLVDPKFAGCMMGIATISYAIAFGSNSLMGGVNAKSFGITLSNSENLSTIQIFVRLLAN
jgi:hypothetical protein